MPAVQAPATVLVTGASGFIAAWTVRKFLERGFTVVGTVRSPSKGEYLKKLFEPEFSGKFSYVIVDDIAKDGAFDEAVKNVDAVAHTASPFHLNGNHPDDYYGPALKGTTGVLESIVKYGSRVKRVVVTSSSAAILSPKDPGYVFTESDWNDHDPKLVEEKGADAGAGSMYSASKSLAERAAWKFVEEKKKSGPLSFDLVTILPPYVFGPIIHEVSSVSSLNTSTAMFRDTVLDTSITSTEDELTSPNGSWVDVRDVADAHVEGILREGAGGQRFVTSAGGFTFQDFLNALSTSEVKGLVKKGYPGVPNKVPNAPYASGAKAAKELGINFISVQQSGVDTVKSLLERFP